MKKKNIKAGSDGGRKRKINYQQKNIRKSRKTDTDSERKTRLSVDTNIRQSRNAETDGEKRTNKEETA